MMPNHILITKLLLGCFLLVPLAALTGCAKKAETAELKKLPPGAVNTGFLSSYANLKQSPRFENTFLFVKQDDAKNIYKYFAVIIDPVEIYVSANMDVSRCRIRAGRPRRRISNTQSRRPSATHFQ